MRFQVRSGLAAALGVLAVVACSDSTNSDSGFVVSGTIQNNTGQPIPAGTRLLVGWTVSSGDPDYAYTFGEGTIDPAAGTFRIEFNDPPPPEALNTGGLGVGIIVATTNPAVGNGYHLDQLSPSEVVGAAGRYGIIYIADPNIQIPLWATAFTAGYGVGVGVDVVNGPDTFQPTSQTGVVLILDNLANIDFVDWT
jgi:hypothetical protein